ncbi:MAG: hypothetical protein MUE60_08225 [Candidatus Eisenbacteria bacterium]|nr:hypothetical protein [Candidatus Eisenbacteria bacterium]
MIDVHVHLLPGLDDGCSSIEESIPLARYLASEGVTHAIATVHHMPGIYDVPVAAVHATLAEVRQALSAESIALDVGVANEVMIHQGLAERVKRQELLGLGAEQRYLLVEFSGREIPWFAFTTLEHLTEFGVTPIVAHPERCYPLHRDLMEVRSWYSKGILAQLDLGSLLGLHGGRIRKFAEFMVRNHLIHLLGSDLHGPPARGDMWTRAYRRIVRLGGEEYARAVSEELPRAVWDGGDIARLVPTPRQSKAFSLFSMARSILGYTARE